MSLGNLVLSVAGLVPGYWASFIFIDRWGRKPIQFMGFATLTVLFLAMGKPLSMCAVYATVTSDVLWVWKVSPMTG